MFGAEFVSFVVRGSFIDTHSLVNLSDEDVKYNNEVIDSAVEYIRIPHQGPLVQIFSSQCLMLRLVHVNNEIT